MMIHKWFATLEISESNSYRFAVLSVLIYANSLRSQICFILVWVIYNILLAVTYVQFTYFYAVRKKLMSARKYTQSKENFMEN